MAGLEPASIQCFKALCSTTELHSQIGDAVRDLNPLPLHRCFLGLGGYFVCYRYTNSIEIVAALSPLVRVAYPRPRLVRT